ncbi:hypothetical protein EBZ39_02900 [bacterium]|nr:hypothetical protein [bacterium]
MSVTAKPTERVAELGLKLPLKMQSVATRQGYVQLTTPVDLFSEGWIAKRLDADMQRGANACWVLMGGASKSAELWRHNSEVKSTTPQAKLQAYRETGPLPNLWHYVPRKGDAA